MKKIKEIAIDEALDLIEFRILTSKKIEVKVIENGHNLDNIFLTIDNEIYKIVRVNEDSELILLEFLVLLKYINENFSSLKRVLEKNLSDFNIKYDRIDFENFVVMLKDKILLVKSGIHTWEAYLTNCICKGIVWEKIKEEEYEKEIEEMKKEVNIFGY